jgi:hypothetical protein
VRARPPAAGSSPTLSACGGVALIFLGRLAFERHKGGHAAYSHRGATHRCLRAESVEGVWFFGPDVLNLVKRQSLARHGRRKALARLGEGGWAFCERCVASIHLGVAQRRCEGRCGHQPHLRVAHAEPQRGRESRVRTSRARAHTRGPAPHVARRLVSQAEAGGGQVGVGVGGARGRAWRGRPALRRGAQAAPLGGSGRPRQDRAGSARCVSLRGLGWRRELAGCH